MVGLFAQHTHTNARTHTHTHTHARTHHAPRKGTLMNAFGSFLGGGEMGRDSDDEDEQAGLAGARRRRGERRIRNPKLAAFYQKRKRVTAVFGPPWLWFIHLSPFLEMGYNAFASLRGSHAARSTTVLGDTHLI